VAAALLRSFDFLELGFSARRPLGNNSLIAKDVCAVLGDEETDENMEYADLVWSEMREHLPEYICRVLASHELRQRELNRAAQTPKPD
jgi:hypothetical protein